MNGGAHAPRLRGIVRTLAVLRLLLMTGVTPAGTPNGYSVERLSEIFRCSDENIYRDLRVFAKVGFKVVRYESAYSVKLEPTHQSDS